MILSGKKIKEELNENIFITPFDEKQLNPNSYNLRLFNELLVYDKHELDMKTPNTASKIIIPEEGLLLETNTLYLGRTVEHTKTNNYVPMLEGRSSIGRLGLFIHVTAGFGDVGFDGFWTLEILCSAYKNLSKCRDFVKFTTTLLKANTNYTKQQIST
ncbi:MAG: dCTP deaminase [Chitinophagales bacterium]